MAVSSFSLSVVSAFIGARSFLLAYSATEQGTAVSCGRLSRQAASVFAYLFFACAVVRRNAIGELYRTVTVSQLGQHALCVHGAMGVSVKHIGLPFH